MDLRIQTSLIAALVCFALGGSVLLRSRTRRDHLLFGAFGISIGLWYLTTFIAALLVDSGWERVNLAFGLLVPLAATRFFRVFLGDEERRLGTFDRVGTVWGLGILVSLATPLYDHLVVRTALLAYVILYLAIPLGMLYRRSQQSESSFDAGRLLFLTVVASLAGFFALLEYLPYVGLDIPPVGTLLVLLFLYMLSQSILRYRLIDLYELAGRLGVLTALSFFLGGILWVLFQFAGARFFLHAVVASLVVLVLFEPLRARVSAQIGQLLFRDRYEFETAVAQLRREVAHVLESDDLTQVLLEGLESSRRITHASLYLAGDGGRAYLLKGHVGPAPVQRLEIAPARPLLERLRRDGALLIEHLERQLSEHLGDAAREVETLYEIQQSLEAMNASLTLALLSEEGELYGILNLRDERMSDAFSPEEVLALRAVAGQAAISLENSRHYQRLKERDRLAALGEMAAGLAHEIRNPLGAIKASAQYLTEGDETIGADDEFLEIIVEEVDRLNRVVGSFLDYARPAPRSATEAIDLNHAVQRTLQLLRPECDAAEVRIELETASLPPIRLDPEELRQVLLNLVRNALEAYGESPPLHEPSIRIETRAPNQGRHWVELRVEDNGPGIAPDVRDTLFVPFVTTKERGTGLGLAVSQRIVNNAGGRIDVQSTAEGTSFVVRFPVPKTLPAS